MKNKFFTNTISNKLIKNLVLNTPLPVYNTVREGDYVVKNCIYVYNISLIKCKKSGYLTSLPTGSSYKGMSIVNPLSHVPIILNPFEQLTYLGISSTDPEKGLVTIKNVEYFPVNFYSHSLEVYPVLVDLSKLRNKLDAGQYTLNYITSGETSGWAFEGTKTIIDLEEYGLKFTIRNNFVGFLFVQFEVNSGDIVSYAPNQERKSDSNLYIFLKNKWIKKEKPVFHNLDMIDYNNQRYIFNGTTWKAVSDAIATFDNIDYDYYLSTYKNKYTEVYHNNSSYYDTTMHERLGAYLRYLRDTYHLDLMSLYNCFSGVYTTRFYMQDEIYYNDELHKKPEKRKVVYESSYDYYKQDNIDLKDRYAHIKERRLPFKVIKVPIKFNTTYTIAIDSPSNLIISPAFISNEHLLKAAFNSEDIDLTSELVNNYDQKGASHPLSKIITNSSFVKPFTFTVMNNNQNIRVNSKVEGKISYEELFQKYEKYLHLLIQISSTNDSSVVILEGDYCNPNLKKIFSNEGLSTGMELTTEKELNKLCQSKLSLLQLSDKVSYTYSDRLIEYLLLNAVDNTESIGDNIVRIQEELSMLENKFVVKGAWDDFLRGSIYKLYAADNRFTHLDNLGYIDKNIENYIYKRWSK